MSDSDELLTEARDALAFLRDKGIPSHINDEVTEQLCDSFEALDRLLSDPNGGDPPRAWVREDGWVARNYVLDRPDRLRLSISLGDQDGGFAGPTWCWFVFDCAQGFSPVVAKGTAGTIGEAKARAAESADRWSREHRP